MADSISYTPTTWADGADGGTPITAARLNNIESGVTNATKQANANAADIKTLGDSVSHFAVGGRVTGVSFTCDDSTDSKLTLKVTFVDGNWWAINFEKSGIFVYDHATNTSTSVQLS